MCESKRQGYHPIDRAHHQAVVVVVLGLDREDDAVAANNVLDGSRGGVEVAAPVGARRYVGPVGHALQTSRLKRRGSDLVAIRRRQFDDKANGDEQKEERKYHSASIRKGTIRK